MKHLIGSKASRLIAFLLTAVILLCAVPSSTAADAPRFWYNDAQDARLKALDCLMTCAFSIEYSGSATGSSSALTRWEKPIWIYMGGSATSDDRDQLNKFIMDIATHCPNMPNIRLASSEQDANIVIWYCPLNEMYKHVDGYHEGNWGYFSYNYNSANNMTGAKIAIASDKNNTASKRHLLREELMGSFGLTNDHYDYSDSILYGEWTTVEQLSEVDWLMLNMLYDPDLHCGTSASRAYDVLRAKILK